MLALWEWDTSILCTVVVWGTAHLVEHVASEDLTKLCGSIPAIFEKQLWLLGSTPTLLTVPRGLAWCERRSALPPPPLYYYKQCVTFLPVNRRSEFPLCTNDHLSRKMAGWGLIYMPTLTKLPGTRYRYGSTWSCRQAVLWNSTCNFVVLERA